MMKTTLILGLALGTLWGCQPSEQPIDTEAELASLEETRTAFMQAISEGRYQDLEKWTDPEIMNIGPASNSWMNMYALGAERGAFPYDSISMHPMETVILNDSMAYDFGMSDVFYTDKDGETVQLNNSYMALLKKGEDGVWRLYREVASGQIPEAWK